MPKEAQIRVLEEEIEQQERLKQDLNRRYDNETNPDNRDEINLEISRVDARITEKRETLALVRPCTHTIPEPTREDWAALEENTRRLEELERADIEFREFMGLAAVILGAIRDRRPQRAQA